MKWPETGKKENIKILNSYDKFLIQILMKIKSKRQHVHTDQTVGRITIKIDYKKQRQIKTLNGITCHFLPVVLLFLRLSKLHCYPVLQFSGSTEHFQSVCREMVAKYSTLLCIGLFASFACFNHLLLDFKTCHL